MRRSPRRRAAARGSTGGSSSNNGNGDPIDAVLSNEELRLLIIAKTIPEPLASGTRSGGIDCALLESDEVRLRAYGSGEISETCKSWHAHCCRGQFLLACQTGLQPGRGDGRFADSQEWFGVHDGPSFEVAPISVSRHVQLHDAVAQAASFVQNQASLGLLTHEWHLCAGYNDRAFPVGSNVNTVVAGIHSLFTGSILKGTVHGVGKGVRFLLSDLKEVYDGRRNMCDRACEARHTDMERGTRPPGRDGVKAGYTSGRVCPCCCTRRCAAEFPAVPSRSAWFGTRRETVLTDALIPLVGRPGEQWCEGCDKFTSDLPQLPGGQVGIAICSQCRQNFGCNECWVDAGDFCETCNVFECYDCQTGWYNGDEGIFCSAHRGVLANDYSDEDADDYDEADYDDDDH